MISAIALLSVVAVASAQSLSTPCTQALANIASNSDASACLSPSSLIPIVAGGTNTSIIQPIDSWLSTLCSAAPCSNATLASIVQNVTTGCASDLTAAGLASSDDSAISSAIQLYYPTFRKIVCLKDGSTNCITETLTNIQNALGAPLSLNTVISFVSDPTTMLLTNKTLTCTDCVKAAYNVLKSDVPSIVSDTDPALSTQCGASFIDGQTPSEISQSASQSSPASAAITSKAAALGATAFLSQGLITGIGMSGLIVVSTVFTFLA